MQLPIFNCQDGKKLLDIECEESDSFAVLKDKIEEELGYEPEEQTFFVGHDTTAPASEVVLVRVDDSVLNKWPVGDAKKCKVFVDLPHAADTVTVESDRILVVGAENNKMTVRPVYCASGPIGFQCKDNTLNVLLDTAADGRTHSVLQYKDERPGTFCIKDQEEGFKVFFMSNEGIEDERSLVGELVDLTQTRTWSELGNDIYLIACNNVGTIGRAVVTAHALHALYNAGEFSFFTHLRKQPNMNILQES